MTEQLKPVLKSYFETGDIPTQTNFENLIDTLQAITPATSGSIAIGTNAVVSGDQSAQIGIGTNTVDNSLKVGTGIIILGEEPIDPNTAANGSLWLNSFGFVCIKSGGKVIKFKQQA